jgi:hypothetical protein
MNGSIFLPTIDIVALVERASELPATFQQNPFGAAIFAGLVVSGLVCWVTVTWLKHRR